MTEISTVQLIESHLPTPDLQLYNDVSELLGALKPTVLESAASWMYVTEIEDAIEESQTDRKPHPDDLAFFAKIRGTSRRLCQLHMDTALASKDVEERQARVREIAGEAVGGFSKRSRSLKEQAAGMNEAGQKRVRQQIGTLALGGKLHHALIFGFGNQQLVFDEISGILAEDEYVVPFLHHIARHAERASEDPASRELCTIVATDIDFRAKDNAMRAGLGRVTDRSVPTAQQTRSFLLSQLAPDTEFVQPNLAGIIEVLKLHTDLFTLEGSTPQEGLNLQVSWLAEQPLTSALRHGLEAYITKRHAVAWNALASLLRPFVDHDRQLYRSNPIN